MKNDGIHQGRALGHLMAMLRIEGLSGHEGGVAAEVRRRLAAAGCNASRMRHDDAPRRLGKDFEVGNLIVDLPGTAAGPRRMLMGHMDTVPLCRGAVPVRRGDRIVARGPTAVRADNRTAVACLVTVAETILRNRLPHPPLTLLFTIAEEIGLYGAKALRADDVGRPAFAVNLDSGDPNEIITGAIGAQRWKVEIAGRSSHAGMHPEHGVSATLIAARAIERVARRGFFGRVVKGAKRGTSNVGIIHGGEATNQVTDRVVVEGECRSHDRAFLRVILAEYRAAFAQAARSVRNHEGSPGRFVFHAESDYRAFKLSDRHPAVRAVVAAARSVGLKPRTISMNGGLDANPLCAAGIPTVTIGAGQHGAHSVAEYVDIPEYLAGCRLALALATA